MGGTRRPKAAAAGRSERGGEILLMARWLTRRRTIGALLAIAVVGALAAAIVVRTSNRATAATGDAPPVVVEFNQADLAAVEAHALARWLPVSGALQPVNQSTVRSKVSGELRQVMVREGETVRAGQAIARFDTADLEARLND